MTAPSAPASGEEAGAPQPPAAPASREAPLLVVVAVLVAFATLLAIAVFPGRMSADSLVQIAQVRAGDYNDWHAGLLLILWRPFWLLGAGPGLVMWTALVCFVLGLYGVLRVAFRRVAAAALTVAITCFPPVLGYVIYFGRDMWFTTFFVVACAALVHADRSSGRMRTLALAGLAVATWLMLAARQNGLPACAVLLLAAAVLCVPHDPQRRVRRVAQALGVAVVASMALVLSQAGMRRVFDVQALHIEQSVFIYDLAALSHDEREVLLDPEVFPSQDLARLDQYFVPSSFEPLVYAANAVVPGYPLAGPVVEELRADWVDAVQERPLDYLEVRMRLWLAQIAVTEPSSWVVHPGIDSNGWGYAPWLPTLDRWVQSYVRAFAANDQLAGGPAHAVWAYLLVLVAGLGFLRSHRPGRRGLAWMCAAALAYQAGLFFSLMIAGYRFNVPCVVLALVVAAVAVHDVARHLAAGDGWLGQTSSGSLRTNRRNTAHPSPSEANDTTTSPRIVRQPGAPAS